jgi:hypothetical protein|nr:MAG TPA: Protein of unknown function (DUF1056) [Caudoviricetes sp.]
MRKLTEKIWLYLEEILTVISLISLTVTGFLINPITGFGAVTLATATAAYLVIKYKGKLYSD